MVQAIGLNAAVAFGEVGIGYTGVQEDQQLPRNPIILRSFLAHDGIICRARYGIARPSVDLSVCPSVTRVDQSKTVEVRIMQLSSFTTE